MTKDRMIYILGTLYTIHIGVPSEEMPDGADGCMDQSIHAIKVAEFERSKNSLQDMDSYMKKVLRHEIIHAFLYESGMWNNSGSSECWGMDEEITDWLAIQSPKIFRVFEEVGCL